MRSIRIALSAGVIAGALASALTALALPARAQSDITIYRCVDASGAVTLQNDVPCPKGSQQTLRKVGVLPTLPAPPATVIKPQAAASAPPPVPATATVVPEPVARTAPPALYQCRTWDERDYLGDTAEPPATCAPVQSIGIDGSSELAAGTTCEMRQDACIAVPAEQLCVSWKKRVDEAEFRWKVGGGRNDDRKAEFDRLSKVYRESTCVG
ncbi:MAG: DUF4124 domain-containing protein [Xanthomonadales bacterium]|nr:DUF4124 domain-containing protein [Xanthomonadales bacterium]